MFRKTMYALPMWTFVCCGLMALAPKPAQAQASTNTLTLTVQYGYYPVGQYVPDIPLTLTPTGACSFQGAGVSAATFNLGRIVYYAGATVTVPFLFHNDGSIEVDCGFMLSDAHQSVLIDHFVYLPDEPIIYTNDFGTIRANVTQNGVSVAQGIVIAKTRSDYYAIYGPYTLPFSLSVFPTSALIMLASTTYGVNLSYDPYITLTTTSLPPGY